MDEPHRIHGNHLNPKAVRVEDAARAVGLGRTTLYGLIANGTIRTVKVGGRRLVPVDALDEFLEAASHKRPCAPTDGQDVRSGAPHFARRPARGGIGEKK